MLPSHLSSRVVIKTVIIIIVISAIGSLIHQFEIYEQTEEELNEKSHLHSEPSVTNVRHLYWNASCPLEERRFSIKSREDSWIHNKDYKKKEWADTYETYTVRAENARDLSLQSGALDVVGEAIEKGAFEGRKILIVGDSLQRELFISLSCLGQSYIDNYAVRWEHDEPGVRITRNEARVRWRTGGEVFFSPLAGNMFTYASWIGHSIPFDQPAELSWIDACHKREPFGFRAYSLPDGTNDDEFENIFLSKDDVIVMNGSVHKSRIQNLENLRTLLDCMEGARRNGTHLEDWPTILYAKSTYLFSQWKGGPRCGINTDLSLQKNELELFESRIDIVGKGLNYTDKSEFHVWGEKTDCVHWFLPGLPDVLAADLTYKIVAKSSDDEQLLQKSRDFLPNFRDQFETMNFRPVPGSDKEEQLQKEMSEETKIEIETDEKSQEEQTKIEIETDEKSQEEQTKIKIETDEKSKEEEIKIEIETDKKSEEKDVNEIPEKTEGALDDETKQSEKNTIEEEEKESDIYWDGSCPIAEIRFSVRSRDDNWHNRSYYKRGHWPDTYESFTLRAEKARDFSLRSGAMDIVRTAVQSGAFKGRKFISIGDSIHRNLFLSLACLAHEDIESYAVEWDHGTLGGRIKWNEGRMRWKQGGELILSPYAGTMFSFSHWVGGSLPKIQPAELGWFDACQNRKPFEFMAYTLPMESRGLWNWTDGSPEFEKVTLSEDDVIVLNAGVHSGSRPGNIENLTAILDCMDDARRDGSNVSWPTFLYSKTSCHSRKSSSKVPRCTKCHKALPDEKEEIEKFGSRIGIIGETLDYLKKEDLHVWGERSDCVHWLLPGLPDLLAADVVYKSVWHRNETNVAFLQKANKTVANFANIKFVPYSGGSTRRHLRESSPSLWEHFRSSLVNVASSHSSHPTSKRDQHDFEDLILQ